MPLAPSPRRRPRLRAHDRIAPRRRGMPQPARRDEAQGAAHAGRYAPATPSSREARAPDRAAGARPTVQARPTRDAGAGARVPRPSPNLAGGGAKLVDAIHLLPRQIEVVAAEVAVGGGLAVQRP